MSEEHHLNSKSAVATIWTRRFIGAAIVHGEIIVRLTVFLVLSQVLFLKPEISRVIASGGAGTWFTFGYTMYIIAGVLGVAVYALFYYYFEKVWEDTTQTCHHRSVGF